MPSDCPAARYARAEQQRKAAQLRFDLPTTSVARINDRAELDVVPITLNHEWAVKFARWILSVYGES